MTILKKIKNKKEEEEEEEEEGTYKVEENNVEL